MYCYRHADREAVGQCIECGKTVCLECKVAFEGRIYCNSCIENRVATTGPGKPVSPAIREPANTSGMGSNAPVPPGLGEFNWGGFLLTWIWGIGNNVWWSFLVFIPYLGLLVIPWVLAFKGNEWAWQSRRWASAEHFKSVQHTWTVWGWALSIAASVLMVLMLFVGLILLLPVLRQYGFRMF